MSLQNGGHFVEASLCGVLELTVCIFAIESYSTPFYNHQGNPGDGTLLVLSLLWQGLSFLSLPWKASIAGWVTLTEVALVAPI